MSNGKNAVRFENTDVVFGQRASDAIAMLDQGKGRDEILKSTNCLIDNNHIRITHHGLIFKPLWSLRKRCACKCYSC